MKFGSILSDLPEAEAELVAGYNVEYSSIIFAMFFLGEYGNILLMSSLFVLFFLGGWDFLGFDSEFMFSCKITFIVFLFVFVRANLPRYRFDQLMVLGWKVFLPLTLSFVFFFSGILISTNSLKISQFHSLSYFDTIFLTK